MSNPTTPKLAVLNGVNVNDASIYKMTKTVLADDHTHELDLEGAASLTRFYVLASHPAAIEIGAKVRDGNKTNTTNEPVYVTTKRPSLSYNQVLGDLIDPHFYFDQYKLPPSPITRRLRH
jgi:hypothetical protein